MDGYDLTKLFCDNYFSRNPSNVKKAEYAVETLIRDEMLEEGLVRNNILPVKPITFKELDPDIDPEVKKKFIDREPGSEATWCPFAGQPDARLIKTGRAEVRFGKIESIEHKVSIPDLMGYNADLREILKEKDSKKMQDQEDDAFFTRCNEIVAANPSQNIESFGGFTRIAYIAAMQAFPINKPIKYAVMNTRMHREMSKWDLVSDYGYGTMGAKVAQSGPPSEYSGVNIIHTIKADIVPDKVVWFFAPQDFLGAFYELQAPKVFIKQEKDFLTFSTYEYVGMSIVNTASLIKATFNP